MNTVGVFAGRGDVILAMLLAGGVGIFCGWYLKKFQLYISPIVKKIVG